MINLNIPTKDCSTDLQAKLEALGLRVMQYNAELHVTGDAGAVTQAQALVETYAFADGVMKDVSKIFQKAVQKHLDETARAAGYDDIVSACSYAAFVNTYQAEGQAFLTWRGAVWDYCFAELAKLKAGTRTRPKIDAFITELPAKV